MDAHSVMWPSVIPGMIVRLMRVAAINLGKDPALKAGLMPKIAEFRRTGDLKLFITVADEVLGPDWLEVGFQHASPTKFDSAIRAVVEGGRHGEASDSLVPDPRDQVSDRSVPHSGRGAGDEPAGLPR